MNFKAQVKQVCKNSLFWLTSGRNSFISPPAQTRRPSPLPPDWKQKFPRKWLNSMQEHQPRDSAPIQEVHHCPPSGRNRALRTLRVDNLLPGVVLPAQLAGITHKFSACSNFLHQIGCCGQTNFQTKPVFNTALIPKTCRLPKRTHPASKWNISTHVESHPSLESQASPLSFSTTSIQRLSGASKQGDGLRRDV